MANRKPNIPIIGIYKITSPSGRIYIGQSWDIKRRWYSHRNENRPRSQIIARSVAKYGAGAHVFEVIHELPASAAQADLDHWERFYIDAAKRNAESLMNMTDGGNNGRPTEEVRARMRGPKSPTHRVNIAAAVAKEWASGRKRAVALSEGTKTRISKTMTGRKYSEERVARAANWPRTQEWKDKISKGLQGKSSTQKLQPFQVMEIRAKYKPRAYSFRRLAAEYGVDNRTIRSVVSRKTFTYL